MGLPHAQPGEVIPVEATASISEVAATRTLFKTQQMEVIRMVLPQGKTIPEHKAPGEIIVQCLNGRVRFQAMGKTLELESGQMFYLPPAEPHAVEALVDCCFLLTIRLPAQ